MSSVDNRVVQMTFDNQAFERKISETIKSLETLQTRLKFDGATKGFGDISSAASKFNLGGMGSAVEGISAKFLALSTIGITVLSNIANRAVDAGITMVKALSFDNIIGGFREYETNINSIQTILSNTQAKGSTLEDVSGALDELNTYADQTIYNFSEMTRNIGTFTAAGVDLDTSVGAIKGIANLAAISGSNSQQASTAMYQLSQAISTGQVRLQDWNSVVNAGLGGEVFQTALFNAGKAAGALADVPIDQTFEQWKDAGNTFRSSLESNWLTGEVLTNTLQGFTGDLTKAQMLSMGYTEEQAVELEKLGKLGNDAATKVKTLTQLIDTVQEAIGSGWAQSFRTIFGDFEEAKELFTGLSETIGDFVGKNADARNQMLDTWKQFGGREALLDGLKNSFKAVTSVLAPLGEAFRTIFPKKKVTDLLNMTRAFRDFAERMIISDHVASDLKRAFTGLFAGIKIGWTVVKELAKVFKRLFSSVGDAGETLDFFAQLGDKIVALKESLVDGGGIATFFETISSKIDDFKESLSTLDLTTIDGIKEALVRLKDAIKDGFSDLFSGLDIGVPDELDGAVSNLESRFGLLVTAGERVVDMFRALKERLQDLPDISPMIDYVKEQFSGLGDKLSESFSTGDFTPIIDAITLGLIGGLIVGIRKFFGEGRKIFEGLGDTLEEMTGVLQAMQTKLKAEALKEIAIAIGILALAVLLLSSINPAALTKAMTGLAVGFGQLVTAMALLNQIAMGPGAAVKLAALSAGIVLFSGAILLLSFAVKVMSTLSWNELSKGLVGVTALLVVLGKTITPLTKNTKGMISAGIGIIGIATGILILSYAVKSFADMDWEEMGKGLAGVAVGLTAITISMSKLPEGMASKGAGIVLLAVGLLILAEAVEKFGNMDLLVMGKGLGAVAVGLILIARGMKLMPKTMFANAAALVLVAFALEKVADSVVKMGALSWKELGVGLVGIAGALIVLAVATSAMSGGLAGATAIGIVAFSLDKLAGAVIKFSSLSLKELAFGLLAMAVSLGVIAGLSVLLAPAIGAMLGLGIALTLLGVGMALFGAGAALTAAAIATISVTGKAAISVLFAVLDQFLIRLPDMIGIFAAAIIALATQLLEGAPAIIDAAVEVIKSLIEGLLTLLPDVAKAIVEIIKTILTVIKDSYPDVFALGFELLVKFLTGIRDNFKELATLGIDMIIELIKAITGKIDDIVAAAIELLTAFIGEIADNIDDVVSAGIDIMLAVIKGIGKKAGEIVTEAANLISDFVKRLGQGAITIISAGKTVIVNVIKGMAKAANDIIEAGAKAIVSFLKGISDNVQYVIDAGFNIIIEFINGVADSIRENSEELRQAGWNLASAIASGMTAGLTDKIPDVTGAASGLANKALDALKKPWNVNSPSKTMIALAESISEGFTKGFDDDTSVARAADRYSSNVTKTFQKTLAHIPMVLQNLDHLNPVISPVLDLTGVKAEAKNISGLLGTSKFTPELSYSKASEIASTRVDVTPEIFDSESVQPGSNDVKFEQNIYAPKALSTADIYRQTRNQITLAQEELKIP